MRHCGGVDSVTRQRILSENPVRDYRQGQYAIYCILPDVPHYFWKDALRGMMENQLPEVPTKYNVYTKLGDTEAVMVYLEEARCLKPQVLILAAVLTEGLLEKLTDLMENTMVILLSEQEKLVNSFYVGSDAFQDGFRMGELYCAQFRDRPLIYLSADGGRNIQLRLDGFRTAVGKRDPELLKRVKMLPVAYEEMIYKRCAPANLALALSQVMDPSVVYCLYIPWGVPQLPVAIGKVRKSGEPMICLTHDAGTSQRHCASDYVISCNQDLYAQGKAAMQAANRFVRERMYPAKKYLFLPSEIKWERISDFRRNDR